ncbi:predicted protein [Sparassis crispa]|uniref:AAA+ ATPase domain-containing protein n=1 Tax=Sparassis crispa TaxID=139825 RepID=A0A401GIK6_9APHY|nr:predicted protein [Sparassis crispa]GBE81988.1 predicted protein [Sparassis crispa]
MRSQLLARRTRSLVKTQPPYHRALISSTHALRYPRKEHPTWSPQATPRLSKRASSSVTPSAVGTDPPAPPLPNPSEPPSEPPSDDVEEKSKRRTSVLTSSKDADASPQLPDGLDILWTPESDPAHPSPSTGSTKALPPPEIFDELLHHLHITFHPQTQHRAVYSSPVGPLVEPTFALYCPIEGGDYYIDQTVRELAGQTGAEVLVLDAVQLAAGESGHFGKAASVLQIPNNPLHFPSSSTSSPASNARAMPIPEDDEFDDPTQFIPTQHMTLHVLAPITSRSRALLASPARSNPMSKLKAFFDDLVNLSSESRTLDVSPDFSPPSPPPRRPRIVYVRDFPTLAPSSSTWYPALLSAVRQRRQGPISRPNSPVVNPMTIIFGITPPFIAPSSPSTSSGPNQGLVNLLNSRSAASSGRLTNQNGKSDYGEDSSGDKGREKRMLKRLKRWARGDVTSQDLPQLSVSSEEADELSGSKPRSTNIVVVGGPEGLSGFPSMLGSALPGSTSSSFGRSSHAYSETDGKTQFFRTSIVMPALRSLSHEKTARMARRREINESTMRMGVAAIGGELTKWERDTDVALSSEQTSMSENEQAMWEEWGKTIQVWSVVRQIADRAVGSVIAQGARELLKSSLEATSIPWSAVCDGWASQRSMQDIWKSMLQDTSVKILHESEANADKKEVDDEPSVDEVVERVKQDPDLDQHEHRLLSCIVDTTSLSTTFSQVHLPPHTIDSVRTVVSLPLLYPVAFQHGILKEHSMAGCLLFGPPGTGKTLVVRALAKEAGCRMLAISPSDVMDMYVGEGEKLVRSVFSLARRLSPCVVFIDELDALFGARVSRETGGGIAHRGVITEFMQEMDGLKSSKEDNVIVIGATNRPFDLDDAVLRRLPRRLLIDLPGEKEREEILKILLRDETLSPGVNLKDLAKKTQSFSGSDLKHLCVSAALDAVKEHVDVPWRAPTSGSTNPVTLTGSAASVVSDATPSQASQAASLEPADALEASADQTNATSGSGPAAETALPSHSRTLSSRNFDKALQEITPSASESLGSLAELRKWNDEFGEGRRERAKQFWGKGRFGFVIETNENNKVGSSENEHEKMEAQPSVSHDSHPVQ